MMLILFLALWAMLCAAVVFAIAVVPTTIATSNRALIGPAVVTGLFSGLVTLCVAGFLSIFF